MIFVTHLEVSHSVSIITELNNPFTNYTSGYWEDPDAAKKTNYY